MFLLFAGKRTYSMATVEESIDAEVEAQAHGFMKQLPNRYETRTEENGFYFTTQVVCVGYVIVLFCM